MELQTNFGTSAAIAETPNTMNVPNSRTGDEFVDNLVRGKFISANSFGITTDLKCIPIDFGQKSRTIVQILGILLDNAIEACLSAHMQTDEPRIELKIHKHENEISIKIWDNGVAIPRRVMPRLFERGVTTKSGIGRGFGLANVKELAKDVKIEQKRDGKEFEVLV